ncbi:MAG: cellulose biosynthesis protein BcsS [Alphaproteobacteria bacterium]|nr:cellulose biosynthesis protein BcsS [Alphaproteobacteria bacterium]
MTNRQGTLRAAALAAASALAAALAAGPAAAEGPAPQVLAYGADSFRDGGGYGLLGAIVGLDTLDKEGVVFNGQVEYLNFDYRNSGGRLVNFDGYGGSAMVGYQFVWDQGNSWAFYAGATYRDLDVKQAGEDPDFEGGNTSLRLETQMHFGENAPVDFTGIAYYVSNSSEFFARGQLGVKLTDYLAIGPEVRVQGSTEYDGVAGGGFVRVRLLDNLTVSANGGYEDMGELRSGYFGFEAGLGF